MRCLSGFITKGSNKPAVDYAVQIVLNTRSSGPAYLSTNLMNTVKSSGLQPGFRMLAQVS